MRFWRFAAVLCISLIILLAAAGAFIYIHRGDLPFLFMKEDPFTPRTEKKPVPPEPAPLPPAAKALPEPPPGKKPLSIENIRVLPYEGKNGGFLPVINAVSGLDGSLSSAARILGAEGTVYPIAADRIEIVPVDASGVASGAPYEVLRGTDGAPTRILVPAEPLALKYYPAEELMSAALAESILTSRSRSFADSPEFIRHGLALYLSGFGDYFEKRFILVTDREPSQMVLPLADTSSYAWADGYWAVKALRDLSGNDGVAAMVKEISSGKGWMEALESASGKKFGDFQDHYKKFAVNYLSVLTVNRQRFKKAVGLLRELDEKEGRLQFLDFTRNLPTDLYAGEARYYLCYSEYRLGGYQKAIDGLLDLLNNSPYSTASQGKAHYFLGRSYEMRGFKSLAVVEYRLGLLEDNELLGKACGLRMKEMER